DDCSHSTADVVRVTAVADAAVHVPGDAGGERDVEEQGPVVRSDGRREGQAEAEPARDDRPAPRTADDGYEPDGHRCQKRPAIDRFEAGDERAGADSPDHDPEHGHRDRRAGPPAEAVHRSTSRSAWPTVTERAPAAASLSRRRR